MVWEGISLEGHTDLHAIAIYILTGAGAVASGFLLVQDNTWPHVWLECEGSSCKMKVLIPLPGLVSTGHGSAGISGFRCVDFSRCFVFVHHLPCLFASLSPLSFPRLLALFAFGLVSIFREVSRFCFWFLC